MNFSDRVGKAGRKTKRGIGAWAGGVGISTALSGGLYGMAAGLTASEASNKPAHYAKYATAAAVDVGSDAILTGIGALIGGPVGWGLAAYSIGAGFLGADPGSLALKAMDKMDEMYDQYTGRTPKFKLTENTMNSLQRSMSHLSGSSAGLAELMHNARDNSIYDYIFDNKQNKQKTICWSDGKVPRRKMAPTYAI